MHRVVELFHQAVGKRVDRMCPANQGEMSEKRFDCRSSAARQTKARSPDIKNIQSRSKLAKIGGVAPCLSRNNGYARGKQGEAMLHETGKCEAILVRLAFGDRGKGCPIAANQSACDPVGTEQANDAADDAGKSDAQHQRYAGVGIGREIGRVRLIQRQIASRCRWRAWSRRARSRAAQTSSRTAERSA